MKSQNGFTLVEVMVSCMILLLVSGMLSAGSVHVLNTKKRSRELEAAAANVGWALPQKEDCIPGEVILNLDSHGEISGEGWLYCGKTSTDSKTVVEIIYVDPMEYEIPRDDGNCFVATDSSAEIPVTEDVGTASNGKREISDEP